MWVRGEKTMYVEIINRDGLVRLLLYLDMGATLLSPSLVVRWCWLVRSAKGMEGMFIDEATRADCSATWLNWGGEGGRRGARIGLGCFSGIIPDLENTINNGQPIGEKQEPNFHLRACASGLGWRWDGVPVPLPDRRMGTVG